jgi:hypothetical protein
MRKIMSANGAAAWERRRFLHWRFFAGGFCAGLSALTRCDFKNPARWAGLLCCRALGACCRRRRRISAAWYPIMHESSHSLAHELYPKVRS